MTGWAIGVGDLGTWQTSLQGRDLDGNPATAEAYYDTVLDVTWLTDANYLRTSGKDADGRMSWPEAQTYLANNKIYGIAGWRLPTVAPVRTGAFNGTFSNNGTTDLGTATGAGWVDGGGKPASEAGHLFYVTLGNLGWYVPNGNGKSTSQISQRYSGLANTGPFSNLPPVPYWTGTAFDDSSAFRVDFYLGKQAPVGNGPVGQGQGAMGYVWPVHSGDVGVPTTATMPYKLLPKIEAGLTAGTSAFSTVSLDHQFTERVVIAGPPSWENSAERGVVRLSGTDPHSFRIKFQTWDYLPPATTPVVVPYLVIPVGRYVLPDGSIWEAGRFTHRNTGTWKGQTFEASFPSAPRLFLTIQTNNGASAVTARARNLSETGFETRMFEQESEMNAHAEETIGYLAVWSRNGQGSVDVDITDLKNVGLKWQSPAYLLRDGSVNSNFTLVSGGLCKLEEEQSYDEETFHGFETVDLLNLGNLVFAQDVSTNGVDTAAIRCLRP